MPSKYNDDDLFKDSTMTFGQHLEELRSCLIKAFLGIAIGVLLALIPPFDLATRTVSFIKEPLEDALQDFYLERAVQMVTPIHSELVDQGANPPAVEELEAVILTDKMAPKVMYVNARSVIENLERIFPGLEMEGSLPRFTSKDFQDAVLFSQLVLEAQEAEGDNPGKRIYSLLSQPAQAALQRLAKADEAEEESYNAEAMQSDVDALAAGLGEIVLNSEFYRPEDFQPVADDSVTFELTASDSRRSKAARDVTRIMPLMGTMPDPRFNRLIISAAFPDSISPGIRKQTLLPMIMWTSVVDDPRASIKSLNPHEMFMVFVKAALIVGVVFSSPWVFWQAWSFVAAGLYPHERRYVYVFLPISLGLFLAGVALAFFFVFQPVLQFLLMFNRMMNVDPDIRISEWFGFALFLPLGFGVSFQLPLVMLFLERIGVFTVGDYLSKWRISVLIIFFLSMILTPADPTSMMLMAVPLTILYFGGVLLCRYMPRGRNPFDDPDELPA